MKPAFVIAAAAFLCAACASAPEAEAPREPSPRAECAEARAIIYFTEESATIQPLSYPLMRDLLARVAACEAAGGALRSLAVVAYPDSGAASAQAGQEVTARQARVRDALIELGAPGDRINLQRGRADRRAPMQRRAEIIADLF